MRVVTTNDVHRARRAALEFLERRPVEHNVILTVTGAAGETGQAGTYFWVEDAGQVCGFAMQTPAAFQATITPAPTPVIDALVDAMASAIPSLPGMYAEAPAAAAFAARWAERMRIPVAPVEAQRIYALERVFPPPLVEGGVRRAAATDAPTATAWAEGFFRDTAVGGRLEVEDPGALVERSIGSQRLHMWETGDGPVAMATVTAPVAGVTRIGFVYTPPECRGRGYASALVARLAQDALDAGIPRCVLYTQLSNPTSNAIYKAVGFEPVTEVLSFRFGSTAHAVRN